MLEVLDALFVDLTHTNNRFVVRIVVTDSIVQVNNDFGVDVEVGIKPMDLQLEKLAEVYEKLGAGGRVVSRNPLVIECEFRTIQGAYGFVYEALASIMMISEMLEREGNVF